MKRIFENIKVKENEKVTDKAMTYNLVAAIIGMILCLASLSAATWAWFGSSVSSSSNTVKAGIYSVDVEIKDEAQTALEAKKDSEGREYYELSSGERYEIVLTGEGTVSSGYCILEYGGRELYTEQIYTDSTEHTPKSIGFYFVAENDARLYVASSWGKYGGTPDLIAGGEYDASSLVQTVENSDAGGAE